ncbi:MAG: hypothetical protein HY554_12240 [Elusimicrobia bacterium]|nr:hypothetical protein [Elusimicrobiota bacterium]
MASKILAAALAFLFALASPVHPSRKSTPRLELTSLKGVVHLRSAGTVQSYSRGSPVPVDIPLGAEVTVRGLEAEFRGMGILVRAAAGDTFAYDLVGGANDGVAIHSAALGDETAMEVVIGESSALLVAGDAIAVSEPDAGRHEVSVLAGAPILLSPTSIVVLGPGQVWARPPLIQPAAGAASREELRSAVGAKPAIPPSESRVRPAPEGGPLDLDKFTPIQPVADWRLEVRGEACRLGDGWTGDELFRWRRRADLPIR